ncbi:MAG: hypothetical protein ACOYB7_16220 [Mycobacterium sp.]
MEIDELIRQSLEQAPGIFSAAGVFDSSEYSTEDAALFVNLAIWQFRRAVRIGLIEDWGNRWPTSVLREVRRERAQIWQQVRRFVPVGAHKSAEYLRDRSGLDATVTDIYELIKRAVLLPVGSYKGWDTFDLNDIDDLIEDDPDWLEWIVSRRIAWEGETIDLREAASAGGIPEASLRRMARELDVCLKPKWGIRERLPHQVVDALVAAAAPPTPSGGDVWEMKLTSRRS